MDKKQKEVEKILLGHEKATFNELKRTYTTALRDIKLKVKQLQSDVETLENANLENKSILQSKIYQLNYQKALEEEINAILEVVKSKNVNNVQSFLTKMYEDSYLGITYNLQAKGIPVITPINNSLIVRTINTPTEKLKFSDRLYKHNKEFKKEVLHQISRGIATGQSYKDIAKQLSLATEVDLNKTYRIARTEGGRVSSEARLTSIRDAREQGADLVKVWDATLDHKTREEHARLDQQWQEVDKPFKVGGMEAMAPHGFGRPDMDVNCRCVLLSVPRWGLEDTVVKYDNEQGALVETKNYQDWKKGYYAKLPELDIVNLVVKEAEERITGYGKEVKITENQIFISKKENQKLAEFYIKHYETQNYLRPHEEERYKKLLELKENGFKEEIITLDNVENCSMLLEKLNWKIENDKNIVDIDTRLLKEATEEIYRITQRVPTLMEQTKVNRYFLKAQPNTSGIANTHINTITLNNSYFNNYKTLYDTEFDNTSLHEFADGTKHSWHTQVAKGNETKSIIVHEMGHIIEGEISWEIAFRSLELRKKFDYLPKNEFGNITIQEVSKELIEEPIRRVMKKENLTRKEVIDKYVSDYGKTNHTEMFAETFANSQLGKSNSLGKELIKYLEELGQWK